MGLSDCWKSRIVHLAGLLLASVAAHGFAAEDHGQLAPYAWPKGQQFNCKTKMTVQVGAQTHTTTGSVFYYVKSAEERSESDLFEDADGSGTGFVVSQDGYLLTCHHVVEGAKEIAVILEGSHYEGTLVGFDAQRDLAIVKIEAAGLAALPLAYDDGIEVGMELRAIGYPLSPVLGESIKVTRGSLSGSAEHDGQRYYQIDATINPGNSGGPVVNMQGEVVGLANMKLSGAGISSVDLAIPGSDTQALLCEHAVGFSSSGNATPLDGPELVRRVRPCVALLKVKARRRVQGGSKRFTLRVSSRMRQEEHSIGDYYSPLSMLRGTGIDANSATLVTDEFGRLLDSEGDASSPIGFEFTGPLGIEAFPDPCPDSWTTDRTSVLAIAVLENQTSRRPGMPPRPPMPAVADPKIADVILIPIQEQCEFDIVRADATEIVLSKRYELTTTSEEEASRMTIKGSGSISFDRRWGLPRSWKFNGTVQLASQGKAGELPVEYEGENVLIENKGRLADLPLPPPAASTVPQETADQRRQALVAARLDQLAAKLGAPKAKDFDVMPALMQLAELEPLESHREKMAGLIERHLDASLGMTRNCAIKALGVWGTERNIPGLAAVIESGNELEKVDALKSLGKIGGTKAIEAIVGSVKTAFDFTRAERVLREIGPIVEPQVIGLVSHDDHEVRVRVCRLLGEIGGRRSADAMQALVDSDPHPQCQRAAQSALENLANRGL